MAFAYFIGEERLKLNSQLNDNIDMKLLNPIIQKVQEIKIQSLLGTDLYNLLITQINADSLTAANTTLLNDYIQPCIEKYIVAEALPYLTYQFRNKGVMKRTSENSIPVDLKEILYLQDKLNNDAEWYAERVTNFLCNNEATYPTYTQNTDATDIKPNKSNYTTNMFLD